MADKKKLIGIYLTLDTLQRLRIYCAKKFLSISEVVERAIKEFLEKDNE